MTALLESPAGDTALSRRDRAILELFYASGLRLSELAGLDLDDVNLSGRMVRVLGKGRKERLVPFNATTATALRVWLKDRAAIAPFREPQGGPEHRRSAGHHVRRSDPLFVNYRGTRLTVRSIDRLVRRYVAASGFRS